MAESSRPTEPHGPILAATSARQGRYGRHMFWVLVIGTLLAAIGLFLAWTWKAPSFAAADAKIAGGHPKAAAAFSAPEPAAVIPQPGKDHTAP